MDCLPLAEQFEHSFSGRIGHQTKYSKTHSSDDGEASAGEAGSVHAYDHDLNRCSVARSRVSAACEHELERWAVAREKRSAVVAIVRSLSLSPAFGGSGRPSTFGGVKRLRDDSMRTTYTVLSVLKKSKFSPLLIICQPPNQT